MKWLLLFCVVFGVSNLFFTCTKDLTEDGYPFVQAKSCMFTRVNGNNLQVCFDSLVNDSRCPMSAQCVWSGAAVIDLSLSVEGQQQSFRLSTPVDFNGGKSEVDVLGYHIKLVKLTPYPGDGSNAPYRAQLEITQ